MTLQTYIRDTAYHKNGKHRHSSRCGGKNFQFRSWQYYVDNCAPKFRITARDHAKIHKAITKEIKQTILDGYPVLLRWIGVFYVEPTMVHKRVKVSQNCTPGYRNLVDKELNKNKYNIPVYPLLKFRQYAKSKRNMYKSYTFAQGVRLGIKISNIAAERGLDYFMQPDSGYYI